MESKDTLIGVETGPTENGTMCHNEDRFRKLVELSPDAIFVHTPESIVFANVAGARLLGYSTPDEVIGKNLFDSVVSLDQVPGRARLLALLNSKSESASHEMRFQKQDGMFSDAEVFLIPSQSRNDGSIEIVARDITERKRAEEQYRTLFEESLDCVFVSSVDGRFLEINSAGIKLFGYSTKEEVLQINIPKDLYCDRHDRETFLRLTREQGFIRDFEYTIKRRDGQRRVVLETTSVIKDLNGEIIGYRGFIRDMTDRNQLEQQLFHAQKMESIGTLVAGITHDFNNILNNINGFALQLKKYYDEPVKVLRYAETIERSGVRGVALANQLLSFVRKKPREIATVQLADIIRDVVSLTRETFPKNITIKEYVEPTLPKIMGDKGEIYQALLNIALNARDAMVEGGSLTLSVQICNNGHLISPRDVVEQHSSSVEITVVDTGPGIPPSIVDKIFDPFFTTKGRGTGTGLGLSIAYSVVKNHNGEVQVESVEGKGTTFRIFFPAAEHASVEKPATNLVTPPNSGNELILLVDDEVVMQELGRELLEENGYRVLVAGDGIEAIEIYKQHSNEIALVVLDLLMPKMDGGRAYLEIRKINKSVKAFFCTGYTSDDLISSLLENEKLRALQKPFVLDEFLQAVREVLDED